MIRDKSSGAVVNNDNTAYALRINEIEKQKKIIRQSQLTETLSDRVKFLEDAVLKLSNRLSNLEEK